MAQAKEPLPVKLIASVFSGAEGLIEKAKEALIERFGPLDYESELLPFNHTDYYTPEFGPGLVRRFFAFAALIDPGELAAIKRWTNELEMKWAAGGRRRVNIDPGYISQSKLVLATTKNHAHRIYLGQGIYAEVTLRFYKGTFRPWQWTYPDYASSAYIALFNHIRERYKEQLKEVLTCRE